MASGAYALVSPCQASHFTSLYLGFVKDSPSSSPSCHQLWEVGGWQEGDHLGLVANAAPQSPPEA